MPHLRANRAVWTGILGILFLGLPAQAELLLVENGEPRGAIVLSDTPSEQATYAAEVLQTYLKKITGATLPITKESDPVQGNRILIGRSAAVTVLGIDVPSGHTSHMNEEAIIIKTVDDALVLVGNEDWNYRGTLFAVYDFLEQDLGCRWYFPGEYGEVLPSLDTVSVGPLDRVERPSFRVRNLWYSGWMPADESARAEFGEWFERNKLNSLQVSLPGDGSISRLAPPDEYFESHPEIFAQNKDGERQREMMCMTEPGGIHIAVETITKTFRENPDVLSFGFAPPDGHPMCYCERCQRFFPGFSGKGYGDPSLSDLWFSFANKIAVEVYKEFPDRWVLTNGYANRVRPPEVFAELSPNLGIQSALLATCTLHRSGDRRCWQRILYEQVMNRWSNAVGPILIYDYDPGKSLDNLPFPTLHCLRHDIPYLRDIGVWGFWTEGCNSWMTTHLNYYIRAKLMWDADADVDALVRDYCERFYGNAADPVEDYMWTLERAVDDSGTHEIWGNPMQWRPILLPVADKLDALIVKAELQATDDATREHVYVLLLTHDHMMEFLAMEVAAADGDFAQAVEHADRVLAIRQEAANIKHGLIPFSSNIAKEHSSSVEIHRAIYQGLADRVNGPTGDLVAMLPRQWEFKTDPEDMGVLYRWYRRGVVTGWKPIDITLNWELQGYEDEKGWGYWGKAWYRTAFEVPPAPDGKEYRLTVGGVYNKGVWVWINGVLRPFEFTPPGRRGSQHSKYPFDVDVTDLIPSGETNYVAILAETEIPGGSARGGLHRRVFLWSPRVE